MSKFRMRACALVLALTLGGIVVCAHDQPREQGAAAKRDCPVGTAERVQCPGQMEEPAPCPFDQPTRCPLADVTPCPEEPNVIVPIVLIEEPKVVPVPPSPVVPVPVTPIVPINKPAVAPTPATPSVMPYRVRMEMVGGVTQIELVRGDELALRVQCDRADVQMPSGGVQAIGKVCVSAPGIDVRCNRLWISWQTGEIAMEGQVRIMCQTGQQRTEMSAESVQCRLSAVGAGLDFSQRAAGKPVNE
ncbi:MAG: hypothetical protein K1X57_00435 [Gemmataceae bacterium]|nr:hypothetical protein [Gemmataceae bacterium]